jgi:hypothetical protein
MAELGVQNTAMLAISGKKRYTYHKLRWLVLAYRLDANQNVPPVEHGKL